MLRVPRHEWSCYLAELIGTFAIVFFGCGAISVLPSGPSAHIAVNLVFGAIVAAMIYTFGHVSKAHFNPAVTLGFTISGQFPLRCAIGYWISQFVGAIVAAGLLVALGIASSGVGATSPTVAIVPAIALEAVLTFFLMIVIVGSAFDRRANGALAGAAIGITVMLCGLFAGPLTGNSLNPARSLGPALFAQGPALSNLGIYFLGPCLGATAAAFVYLKVIGRGQLAEPEKTSCCPVC